MNDKLSSLAEQIARKIRGQAHVIPRVVSVLQRGEYGLTPQGRPKGSFLFLGPTGVGKTELALVFTEILFGREYLHRFDMSEFQHPDQIKNFIGDETGYAGRLGTVLAKHRHGTLLFDEMEKAHPLIMDVFLQILDAGRVTVGRDELHDLSNFYVVFTSNIAAKDLMDVRNLPQARLERFVLDTLNDQLRPELVARISEKLVFNKLSYEIQREIAQLILSSELERFARLKNFTMRPKDDSVLEFLIRKGIDKVYGARPMRGTVEKFIQDALVQFFLSQQQMPAALSAELTVDPVKQCLVLVPSCD